MTEYGIKIKNEWIETTADLFTEWFDYGNGHKKGVRAFLEDEKLDKIFSVGTFMDVMIGKARLPAIFSAPLAKSCPFGLDLKEAADLINISKVRFRFAYDVAMERDDILLFHAQFLSPKELRKFKKEVREEAFHNQTFKEAVGKLGRNKAEEFLSYRKCYLTRNGIDINGWDDEKIKTHRVKAGKTKKQRTLDGKRRKMISRGFNEASDMSYEELEAFSFPKRVAAKVELTAEEYNRLTSIYRKKHQMKKRGIDVGKMTHEAIEAYILPKLKPGRIKEELSSEEKFLRYKKKRLEGLGIDISGWSDEKIKDYIKPRTDLSFEQRKINRKRKFLERQGFDVANSSDEEIMLDHRRTGRQTNHEFWIKRKRKGMIADGVAGAESMSDKEVEGYSKYNRDGSWAENSALYKKKRRLDEQKIDYTDWTDEEIIGYDGRKKGCFEEISARAAKRREDWRNLPPIIHQPVEPEAKEETFSEKKATRLPIFDPEKNLAAKIKFQKYYQNRVAKNSRD